jgi:hypothetical protein
MGAALDTLWFDLDLDDKKLQAKVNALKEQLKNIGVNAEGIKITANKAELSKNIREALQNGGTPYRINVTVDKSSAAKAVQSALEGAGLGQNKSFSASDARYMVAQAKAAGEAQKAADAHSIALEKMSAASARAQRAQLALANAHQRATDSTNMHISANARLGSSLTGLVSITGDLRNQIGMLVSAYTVEHLLRNVVMIGGEFEKQKLAMGSMFGSIEQADDIFNKMKNLALTSPFNFKDLSNYSRQLAAYGTQYKDLYDTTNRLADMSAGLGGDMSRLVLAFSQVKAAAYLRGQEMRQFTEFGVSLPELLAKKYSEAEGKIVTAGDVIERVSKRMVSFNDVKDVLWKETDKGGKFYGMQNVLSQSVSGMASNLRDAIDTAYYDIANSNSGVIKESIKGLTELVSKWRELSSVLITGVAIYSVQRMGLALYNRAIGQGVAATLNSVMAAKSEEVELLKRKALTKELSVAEKELIASGNKLSTSQLMQLTANRAINEESLMRLVATKQVTAAQALQASSNLMLNASELQFLNTLRSIDIQLAVSHGMWKTFTLNVAKNFTLLGENIKIIGRGIKATLASVLSPANVAMAGIFFIADAIMEYKQKISQLDDANKQTIKNAEDGFKNLNDFLQNNPIEIKGKSQDELQNMIDSYEQQLTSTPIDFSSFLLNVDSITDTSKKLSVLRKELESLRDADYAVSKNGNGFMSAQKSDTNWLSDWIYGIGLGVGKLLTKIGILPEGLRHVMNANDELAQNVTGVISDVSSNLNELQAQMAKLSQTDINKGLDAMREKLPDVAAKIERMRDAGASNNEVIMAMMNTAYNNNTNYLPGIDPTTFNKYNEAYDAMIYKFQSLAQDGVERINSQMDKVDVEGHTEKWRLAVIKARDEEAKTLNLSGEDLDAWNFITEQVLNRNSLRIQDHPKYWKDMAESVKQTLAKEKTDIEHATQSQIDAAVKQFNDGYVLLHGYTKSFIDSQNAYTRKHPIYIWNELKMLNSNPKAALTGNGRSLASNVSLSKWFSYDDFAGMTDDEKQLEAFKKKDEALNKDWQNAAQVRSKNASELKKKWKDFRNTTNAYIDWDWGSNYKKDGTPKKTGKTGGSQADELLKYVRAQKETITKAMDIYKKSVADGFSQADSIKKMSDSGIFPKGMFDGVTNETQLDAWYKKEYQKLVNSLKRAKSNTERKKELATLLADMFTVNGDDFKKQWEAKTQIVEQQLKDMKEKWDTYKRMFEITGDKTFSMRNAFGTDADSFGDYGKYLRERVQKESNNSANMDQLMGMSEQEIKSKFSGYGEILIKLVQGYREYLKSERSDEEKMYEESIKSTMGYYAKVIELREEYNRKIKIANEKGDDITANKLQSEKLSKIDALNPENVLFYQSALSFTKERARDIGQSLKDGLVEQMRQGTISAHDYAEQIEKINKLLQESEDRKTPMQSLMTGGLKSYYENLYNTGQRNVSTGAVEQSVGKDFYDQYSKIARTTQAGTQENINARMMMNLAQKLMEDGEKLDKIGKKMEDVISKHLEVLNKVSDISGFIDKSTQSGTQASSNILDLMSHSDKYKNSNGIITATAVNSSVSAISSGINSMVKDLQNGDIISTISDFTQATGSVVSNVSKNHDDRVKKEADKISEDIQNMKDAYQYIQDSMKYALGNQAKGTAYVSDYYKKEYDAYKKALEIKKKLSNQSSISKDELKDLQAAEKTINNTSDMIKNYADTGNVYTYQLELLKKQREDLVKLRHKEELLKDTDQDKLNEFDTQISEYDVKIMQYWQKIGEQVYGIDLKDWANQFGDALFEAWQKGESGATAFDKTANSIISGLVKKMFDTNLIQPLFNDMNDYLYGENGVLTDGDMSDSDLEGLFGYFNKIETAVSTGSEWLDKINEKYKAATGRSLTDTTSSGSTTNSLTGATEQEVNMLVAYADAVRQDTFNIREFTKKIYELQDGVTSHIMNSQLQQLQQISTNTYRNADMAERIYGLISGNMNGNANNRIHVA